MKRLGFALGIWLAMVIPSSAQTILNYTTLNGAVSATATTVVLTSVSLHGTSNVPAPAAGQMIYVDHEAMSVTAVSGTRLTVIRGQSGTAAAAHPTSSQVFTGPGSAFQQRDPLLQACVAASVGFRPWINVLTGNVWVCENSLWQATNVMKITYNSTTSF